MRTLLAVSPADAGALIAGLAAEPDALVLDSTVADPTRARDALGRERRVPRILVQLSAAEDGPDPEALRAVAPLGPTGIVLAGCAGRRDVERLSARLAVHEAEHELPDGSLLILPCVDSAKGWIGLGSLSGASRRLCGILWNEGALRADLGLRPDGPAPAPCLSVRAAVVLAARAAGVPAIDCASPPDLGPNEVAAVARTARQDGFAGKLASAPDQVATIASAFA